MATIERNAEALGKKSAWESASPNQGAEESAEKSAPSAFAYMTSTEARNPKYFLGTFLGTPFGRGTFLSTLLGTLLAQGFGTHFNGCHDRNYIV